MQSISDVREALRHAKGGRPREIEPKTNLYVIHPASRALVPYLYVLRLSPNVVSVMGALAAIVAVACFLWLPWPWNALAGFVGLIAKHILDGADGQLARVSGKSSTLGDLVDGLCDGFSVFLIQIALAFPLAAEIGPAAYAIAAAGLVSYIIQVNGYEGRRRQYIHWVYGRPVITPDAPAAGGQLRRHGRVMRLLRAGFAIYFAQSSFEARGLQQALERCLAEGEPVAGRARERYKARKRAVVSRFSWLGENQKSIAASLAILAGSPLYLYIYLFAAMNLVLIALLIWQSRVDRDLAAELGALCEKDADARK